MPNTPFYPQPRQVLPPLVSGPFVGVRDSEESGDGDPRKARYAQNLFPQDLRRPSPFVGRPGHRQAGDIGGGVGARTGQLVVQFTEPDGTEHTVRIVGGKFYTYDWVGDAWTETLEAADFSGASITLSPTARCYAVTYNGELVVSDGVNNPWTWDGTAGGGLTSLTNAPVAYGAPTVYGAKLFFIKATEPTVIVWSEENAANTGYEAGGYNNSWELTQTDPNRLFAIMGGNESLDVFRFASTTSIFGAVTEDFATTHTREVGSETMGTRSPGSLAIYDRLIFFLGGDYKPHVRIPGAGVVEIFDDCMETIYSLNPDEVDEAMGIWDPVTELVLFAVCSATATVPDVIMAFNPKAAVPQFVGVWTGLTIQAWGTVKDEDGRERLMHLDDEGYAYFNGLLTEDIWDDELASGTVPISHIFESPTVGYSHDVEKTFLKLSLSLITYTSTSNISAFISAPNVSNSLIFSVEGGFTRWDLFNWDEDSWSSRSGELKKSVGFHRNGRWCRWKVLHSELTERFGLASGAIQAAIDAEHPEVV